MTEEFPKGYPEENEGPIPDPEEQTNIFDELDEDEKQELLDRIEKKLKGEEDPGEGSDDSDQQISIGLTPNGGVGIKIQDTEGNAAAYFINEPSELWQMAGHLQSLATILVQTHYAMAMQEQKMMEELLKTQTLYVPGHGQIG